MVLCRKREGEVSLYRLDERRRVTASDKVEVTLQASSGLGEDGVVFLSSWWSPRWL